MKIIKMKIKFYLIINKPQYPQQINKRKLFKIIRNYKVQKLMIYQLKVYINAKQIQKIKQKQNNKKLVPNKIYQYPMTKD